MKKEALNINQVFLALADSNRRKIVELLYEGDSTLLELSEHFPISFQALSKHIKILEKSQVLNKEKKGKYNLLSLNRNTLKLPLEWISFYSNFWNESFDKLDDIIHKRNMDGNS